jgi:hypothetical protein
MRLHRAHHGLSNATSRAAIRAVMRKLCAVRARCLCRFVESARGAASTVCPRTCGPVEVVNDIRAVSARVSRLCLVPVGVCYAPVKFSPSRRDRHENFARRVLSRPAMEWGDRGRLL